MSNPCKKNPNSSACKSAKAALICEENPEGLKCKKIQREVHYAEVMEGKRTQDDFNASIQKAIQFTEGGLDYARAGRESAVALFGAINTASDIYNDMVALSKAKAKCTILTPEELNKLLGEGEESVWERLWAEYIDPGDKFLEICKEECRSDIVDALESAGNNPSIGAFYALWQALTEEKKISACASPYLDRFFNMVPYMYYISQILQNVAGDVLEAMADSLTEEEEKIVWQNTPCGQEAIVDLVTKGMFDKTGHLPAIPEIPHIPPIPYINIPSVMDVVWAIVTDAICFAICCILEPLMTMVTQAMDESFKEWMEEWDEESLEDDPSEFGDKFLNHNRNIMPPLKKVDINQFVPEEILQKAIENKLVSEDVTIKELRDYITYFTADTEGLKATFGEAVPLAILNFSQRKVVHLLMGNTDCKSLNVLLLVGYPTFKPDEDGECPDNTYKVGSGPTSACKPIGFAATGLIQLPKPDLSTESKILEFWKYLGDNIDIFGILQKARDDEDCIPEFCITRDKWAKEQFIDLNNQLCALLNPKIGLPDISIESLLEGIGANKAIVDTMQLQVGTLSEMAETIMNTSLPDSTGIVGSEYLADYEKNIILNSVKPKDKAGLHTNIVMENIMPNLKFNTSDKLTLTQKYSSKLLREKLKLHMQGKSLTDDPPMEFFGEIKNKFGGKKYMVKVANEFKFIREEIKQVKIKQIEKRQAQERKDLLAG